MTDAILTQFGFNKNDCEVSKFGSGLINNTWLVAVPGKDFILQRINQNIFKNPAAIDENIQRIAVYLKEHYPDYIFTVPVSTMDGRTLVMDDSGAYRLFDFIQGSKTYDVLQQPQQAYEAAKQFGKFTKLLNGFDAESLQVTLPDFHDLSLRYAQFEKAVEEGNKDRIEHAAHLIKTLKNRQGIVKTFEEIKANPAFKKRVTHHDTKISNVLFDGDDKGICVIDLDTVMAGYFISDAGDMMRTYLPSVSEDEIDLEKVTIREEYFDAILQGYLGEMKEALSADELDAFVYAGQFMIYMQALRFMADYLNDDVYYAIKYTLHNYNRAANQVVLLEDLMAKENLFKQKVEQF